MKFMLYRWHKKIYIYIYITQKVKRGLRGRERIWNAGGALREKGISFHGANSCLFIPHHMHSHDLQTIHHNYGAQKSYIDISCKYSVFSLLLLKLPLWTKGLTHFFLVLGDVDWKTEDADMRFSIYCPSTWFSDRNFRFSSFTLSTRCDKSVGRQVGSQQVVKITEFGPV